MELLLVHRNFEARTIAPEMQRTASGIAGMCVAKTMCLPALPAAKGGLMVITSSGTDCLNGRARQRRGGWQYLRRGLLLCTFSLVFPFMAWSQERGRLGPEGKVLTSL